MSLTIGDFHGYTMPDPCELSLYVDATAAAVAIMRSAQAELYHGLNSDWITGYRILTRAMTYIDATYQPAVKRMTVSVSDCETGE